jgi:hypothetical protein
VAPRQLESCEADANVANRQDFGLEPRIVGGTCCQPPKSPLPQTAITAPLLQPVDHLWHHQVARVHDEIDTAKAS